VRRANAPPCASGTNSSLHIACVLGDVSSLKSCTGGYLCQKPYQGYGGHAKETTRPIYCPLSFSHCLLALIQAEYSSTFSKNQCYNRALSRLCCSPLQVRRQNPASQNLQVTVNPHMSWKRSCISFCFQGYSFEAQVSIVITLCPKTRRAVFYTTAQ